MIWTVLLLVPIVLYFLPFIRIWHMHGAVILSQNERACECVFGGEGDDVEWGQG